MEKNIYIYIYIHYIYIYIYTIYIHIYIKLSHFVEQQKLAHHYKSTIFQQNKLLKINDNIKLQYNVPQAMVSENMKSGRCPKGTGQRECIFQHPTNGGVNPGFQLSLGRQWHPTPVLLPGKSHGRRSLVGCSPWGL